MRGLKLSFPLFICSVFIKEVTLSFKCFAFSFLMALSLELKLFSNKDSLISSCSIPIIIKSLKLSLFSFKLEEKFKVILSFKVKS